jgi:DNA-binding NtrC family response regulator
MTDPSHPILIVDDDASVTASLSLLLKQAGLPSVTASDPDAAMAAMDAQPVSMVVQDMNFSRQTTGEEGLALLREVRSREPSMPVILITAWGSIQLAVEGMKAGATDFVTKPWNNQHLLQLIRTALSLSQPEAEPAVSREDLDQRFDFSEIIGEHQSMIKVLNTVARVCATDASVLILGESGTGKELIADALHGNSPRSGSELVKVNLGGIQETLFESEMFGHVRGAFTDAKSNRKGRFEKAEGGTIFLDEVGDLDKASQVKLLRVLQDRSYQPVGASETRHADVRVISATNRDLAAMVREDAFREDLLYRLNLITIRMPPLRERATDIRLIANQHLLRVAELYGVSKISIDEKAFRWLQSLHWPGNVRQLRQTVERAVLMSGKRTLGKDDFVDPEVVENQPSGNVSLTGVDHLTLDEVERLMIEKSLDRNDNNISRTAADLGLSRAALYRRLEKHQIEQ